MDVEIQQEQFKKHAQEHLRTVLQQENYKDIRCVLIITNEVTGKVDVSAQNCGNGLTATIKGYLREALDMLNRIQLVTSICGQLVQNKEKKDDK